MFGLYCKEAILLRKLKRLLKIVTKIINEGYKRQSFNYKIFVKLRYTIILFLFSTFDKLKILMWLSYLPSVPTSGLNYKRRHGTIGPFGIYICVAVTQLR